MNNSRYKLGDRELWFGFTQIYYISIRYIVRFLTAQQHQWKWIIVDIRGETKMNFYVLYDLVAAKWILILVQSNDVNFTDNWNQCKPCVLIIMNKHI